MNFVENGKVNVELVKDEVTAMVSEISEISVDEIGEEDSFVDDLGLDSLLALEILAAIEKRFKVDIAEENLPKMQSLNQTLEVTLHCIREKYSCE